MLFSLRVFLLLAQLLQPINWLKDHLGPLYLDNFHSFSTDLLPVRPFPGLGPAKAPIQYIRIQVVFQPWSIQHQGTCLDNYHVQCFLCARCSVQHLWSRSSYRVLQKGLWMGICFTLHYHHKNGWSRAGGRCSQISYLPCSHGLAHRASKLRFVLLSTRSPTARPCADGRMENLALQVVPLRWRW